MPPFHAPRPAFQESARRRSLAVLFRAVAAMATLAALGACGGGGGGDAPAPPSPPPAPTPAPAPAPTAPMAAQMSVPTPVGYDAERLAAFDRLNEIRLSAGLGMLAQDTALDQAAQAHADWIIANDSFTHDETDGTTGFSGVHWWDRDEALGYVPLGGDEVMVGPELGAQGVDVLVNTVYHRAAMLAFEPVDVGVGWSGSVASSISMPLVIDMTRPGMDTVRGLGQTAQVAIHGVAIWPLDGAREVALRLGLEVPDPVPAQDVSSLGTPVSITLDRMKTISTTMFVLSEASTGTPVPSQLLTACDDPNSLIPGSFVALVPLRALEPSTTYQVSYSGSAVAFPSGATEALVRTWSFTTAAQ